MVVAVAFNIGARQTFDYAAPSENETELTGKRVVAPLAGKQAAGVVMEARKTTTVPAHRLLPITRVMDDMPRLPPATLKLIQFCADYYHCPIGTVAASALPVLFRRVSAFAPPCAYQLAQTKTPKPEREQARKIVDALSGGKTLTAADIGESASKPSAELRRLVREGIVRRVFHATADAFSQTTTTTTPPPQLTSEQQQALQNIKTENGFAAHLLLGATGSGKTEVYLRAAQKVAANNKQVLILAPEIGLTPQMAQTVRARMPAAKVCVLHSGLPDGERAARWLSAARGDADIVLGTRSAVFTPMPRLGLIIVDEEHDESYKQQDGFSFSARDVAVWRARAEKIPHLAASATPSLESYHNGKRGKYKLLRLRKRLHSAPPKTELTDETQSALYHGVASPLLDAAGECARNGEQALIFINRRGYAPLAFCRECKLSRRCKHCATSMTVHKRRRRLLCHWCGFSLPLDSSCEKCGGALTALGAGTQRVEEALRRRFPQADIARMDSDALSGAGAFAREATAAAEGKRALLVGTQIVAKGHNFPHLSLIGILGADGGLFAPDFRAQERLLASLSQVVGRGTRNPKGCRVMIQTSHPHHPFYQLLLRDDIEGCWRLLLEERKRAGLPPFSHLALLRASAKSERALHNFLTSSAKLAQTRREKSVTIYAPVPSLRAKMAGRYHGQLLTSSPNRAELHNFIKNWLPRLPKTAARWRMDIDPVAV